MIAEEIESNCNELFSKEDCHIAVYFYNSFEKAEPDPNYESEIYEKEFCIYHDLYSFIIDQETSQTKLLLEIINFQGVLFGLNILNLFNKIAGEDNKNLFKYGDEFSVYIYLSNNELNQNFNQIKQSILKFENITYDNKNLNEFDSKLDNWKWLVDIKSGDRSFKKYKHQYLRANSNRYTFFSKYNPIINIYYLNTTILNNFKNNDEIYLHFDVFKVENLNNSNNFKPTLYKTKKLNLTNWITNYTINLVDHRQNIDQFGKTSFSKLYNLVDNYYSPALSIDNTDNNYELININETKLPLYLKFNQINFCQFIIYSCNQSSKDSQLKQICFEESAKLSTNLFFFLFYDFPYKNNFQFDGTVGVISIVLAPFIIYDFSFFFNFNLYNLKGISIKLIIFDCFKSFVFLLYELNRFPYLKCNAYKFESFFQINLIVIIAWSLISLMNLFKLFKVFKLNYHELTKKYDNLSFKYLSFVMIPLFIIYSYYTFHYKYHRNWYSYLLNTLYGYLLNFGFIAMATQVYINYKLNSFPPLFHRYFFIFLVFKLLMITIEDIIDYHYVYRETHKLIYFRDELFAFIFIIQNWYYGKKSSINLNKSNDAIEIDDINLKEKSQIKAREIISLELQYLLWLFTWVSIFLITFYISKLDRSFEIDNRNLFKEDDKFNFNIYLTDKLNKNRLFDENLVGLINGDYNFTTDNYYDWTCKFNQTLYVSNCKLRKQFRIDTKYFPIANTYHFNKSIEITELYKDDLYLHINITKLDHLNNSNKFEPTLYRTKKLNLTNWITNYTINLVDHRQNIDQFGKTSFSKLYNLVDNYYSPALSIDNTDNNYELININETKLPLYLKFNQINFCQFIIYSCNQSSKDKQLNRICFEESSKLSTNLFYFFLIETPNYFFVDTLKYDEIKTYRLISLISILIIITGLILILDLQFIFDKLHLSNLKGLSIKLIIFDCFKSFVFFLYELNRFPYLKCNFHSYFYRHFLYTNALIIFGWLVIILINLYKLSKIFKFNFNYRKPYHELTKKYDNLSFKYLSFVMIPLFIIYSYYTFHYKYHQNWYSYILNTLYGYLLNFGFIAMAAQVYINYKLQIPNYLEKYFKIIFLRTILIGMEDVVDFRFEWRDSYKFMYLREELFYSIYLVQLFYQKKMTKYNNYKQN